MKAVNPTTKQLINRTALAILAAYALTTVHHIYGGLVDGAPNRLRVPGIMPIPSLVALGSLRRYKRTGSGAALATSTTVAVLAWVVLSGLLHGGYAHAYNDILFEITGVLETVTAYFIALFTYRLIRDRQQRGHPASAQGQVIPSRQP